MATKLRRLHITLLEEVFVGATIFSVSLLLMSCVTTQESKGGEGGRAVDAGYYAVRTPSEGSWEADVNKDEGSVFLYTQRGAFTEIVIFRYVLPGNKWNMSEGEAADDLREFLEGRKREKAEAQFINKKVVIIRGKTLHTMHYRFLAGGDPLFRTIGDEQKLFIYFPPDFKERHALYIFTISRVYLRDPVTGDSRGMGEEELKLIHDVITSFQVK